MSEKTNTDEIEFCLYIAILRRCPKCGGRVGMYRKGSGPDFIRCDSCQAILKYEELVDQKR